LLYSLTALLAGGHLKNITVLKVKVIKKGKYNDAPKAGLKFKVYSV
jgi:hypothetical protein